MAGVLGPDGGPEPGIERLPPRLVEAYLRRLGLGLAAVATRPRDVALLADLHRAHVEQVSYDNLDIYRGSPRGIDPVGAARHVAGGGGGYCFHQNGALSSLLHTLGFRVRRHVGGVRVRPDSDLRWARTNHLVVTVELDGRRWLVDCGLGDLLHEPVLLQPGAFRQAGFGYRLERLVGAAAAEWRDDGRDGEAPDDEAPEVGEQQQVWRLHHDPAQKSFHDMTFDLVPVPMAVFEQRHEWLSRDPGSGFVTVCAVERRTADGVEALRGLVRHRLTADARSEVEITDAARYFAVLEQDFGLGAVRRLTAGEREVLWRRLVQDHAVWVAERDTRQP